MKVILKRLDLQNFKNHKEFSENFGALNIVKGINGSGKSSIGEAISWVLFGTDMMGSKLDPTPQDSNGVWNTWGSTVFDVDGKEIEFSRELMKNKTHFEINDVPKKATEFDEIVKSMFDKDLFLSLFNPSYFPALHWTKQREMVLSYVTPPAMKEVFSTLPELQAKALAEAFKKHNIDDLEAIHKKNKTQKEKDLIAAKSRVATLEESNTATPHDLGELEASLEKVSKEIAEAAKIMEEFSTVKARLLVRESGLKDLFRQVEQIRAEFTEAKAATHCPTCEQGLIEESKSATLHSINARYKEKAAHYKALKAEIDSTVVPPNFDSDKFNELQETRDGLRQSIRTEKARQEAVAKIEEAKKNVESVQQSLNESIFLLDAIKAYRAKEAELQANKVADLFPTLTIKLYNVTKDGTENPTFEIEKDGKPYSKLSLGEKARAGLEFIEVLAQQSGISSLCFVDNAESITTKTICPEHSSQVIAAYAVPNQNLIMEVDQ